MLGSEPGLLHVVVVADDPRHRRLLEALLRSCPGIQLMEEAAPRHPLSVGPEPAGVVSVRAAGGGAPVLSGTSPRLAPRQSEVLVAYAASNALLSVVARELGMNEETLKTHLRRIRVKYRAAGRPAPTRRDLYVRALEDGLLPVPSPHDGPSGLAASLDVVA